MVSPFYTPSLLVVKIQCECVWGGVAFIDTISLYPWLTAADSTAYTWSFLLYFCQKYGYFSMSPLCCICYFVITFSVRSVFLKRVLSILQNKVVIYTTCIRVNYLVSFIPYNSAAVLTGGGGLPGKHYLLLALCVCVTSFYSHFFLFCWWPDLFIFFQVFLTFLRVRTFFSLFTSAVLLLRSASSCSWLFLSLLLHHPYYHTKFFYSVVYDCG